MNVTMVVNGSGLNVMLLGTAQTELWVKLQVTTYLMWIASVAAVQISILFFYVRGFGIMRTFRVICFAAMGIVVCWFIGAFFSYLFTCDPVQKLWDSKLHGTCTLGTKLCASTGVIHIIIDMSVLMMALPLVWNLNTSLTSKAVLTAVFTLGLLYVSFPSPLTTNPLNGHLARVSAPSCVSNV